MSLKPSGGRGKKAPYNTVVVRVPVPIVSEVERMIEDYRESAFTGIAVPGKLCDRTAAIEEAKKIIRLKKSAKQSVLKLLQVLYGSDITEDNLV